jgi:hypothetical protein
MGDDCAGIISSKLIYMRLSMTFDVQILTTHGLRGVWETNESFGRLGRWARLLQRKVFGLKVFIHLVL